MGSDDLVQLINIQNIYALAVDTQRWSLFDLVFTPDVDADFGSARWCDLDGFKRDFATIHAVMDRTQHTITNHQAVVEGDRATGVCYGNWRLMRQVSHGGSPVWTGGGYYEDSFVRTGQGWRIAARKCRVLWWDGNPLVGMLPAADHMDPDPPSLRDMADRLDYVAALAAQDR